MGGERDGKGGGGEREEGGKIEGKEERESVQEGPRKLAHITTVSGLHCNTSLSWLAGLSFTNATGICSFS